MLELKEFLKSALRGKAVYAMLLFVCCSVNPADSVNDGSGAANLPNTSGDSTGLVFGDGRGPGDTRPGSVNRQAWVKCKTTPTGNIFCDGYFFFTQLPFGGTGKQWVGVEYNGNKDCWLFREIASNGYFVSNDSLKIGYSAMLPDGVGWSFSFSGTYKVSGDTLTLSEAGKEPVIYKKRDIPKWCE